MFTGIIEHIGLVREVAESGSNRIFWIESPISAGLKIDQSVAHSGVCLTVEAITGQMHQVTAVDETLKKTNLGSWHPGDAVNLERSLLPNTRVDGHFVQGHVDTTAICRRIRERDGSHEIEFRFPKKFAPLVIEKGSVCVNGISLTAFDVKKDSFRVAIIPYTLLHTNLRFLKEEQEVNIEFDMLGKYILRKLSLEK
jgi:riboflavin synthase